MSETPEKICGCQMGSMQSTHGGGDGRRYCDFCGWPLISRAEYAEEQRLERIRDAAPDLYNSLKEMLEMGELFIPAKLHSPGFKRARAALAKAAPFPPTKQNEGDA